MSSTDAGLMTQTIVDALRVLCDDSPARGLVPVVGVLPVHFAQTGLRRLVPLDVGTVSCLVADGAHGRPVVFATRAVVVGVLLGYRGWCHITLVQSARIWICRLFRSIVGSLAPHAGLL